MSELMVLWASEWTELIHSPNGAPEAARRAHHPNRSCRKPLFTKVIMADDLTA